MTLTAIQCLCGFTELADETVTDHLLQVFVPADMAGKDGLVHEEVRKMACLCGFAATTPEQLDGHFLAAFTPDDAIGPDGKKHATHRAA